MKDVLLAHMNSEVMEFWKMIVQNDFWVMKNSAFFRRVWAVVVPLFFGGSDLWEANAGDGELRRMRNALGAQSKSTKNMRN